MPSRFQVLATEDPTGYTVVELFAGAGGMALGLENAGLNHLLLNEIDKVAVQTLRHNRPDWPVVHDDVRNLSFRMLGDVDIVQAGFPCQAFSAAGRRRGFDDPRGVLFFEFVRAIRTIRPKIALGENVSALKWHDGGRTLRFMLAAIRKCGYRVEWQVLGAHRYDVPQKRERLFMWAVREDLNVPVIFPEPQGYQVTVRDAIADVPESRGERYSERRARVLRLVPEGGNWRDLPQPERDDYTNHGKRSSSGVARRLSWDEPAPTLLCKPQASRIERCHPGETRPLNIREYARIQTFPDSWEFSGSMEAQYRQIGNAVPVNLGYHVGRALIAMLDSRHG